LRYEVGRAQMHSLFTYFSPHDPGYVVDVSGAAVLRSSKQRAAAEALAAYLVSVAGQETIANPKQSTSYEYPIGSGVVTRAPETPLSQLQPCPLTVAELGDGQSAVTLLRQAGLL
jgi:iron(III) transport system substrate-binding protein